jgi:hypothetical protein
MVLSNNKQTVSYPISYGLKNTGLPLIVVEINQQNLCFLLDTGSNKNLIDQRVYEFFKEQVETVGCSTILGLEGNKQDSAVIKLNFNFENHSYSTNFNVFDSSNAFGTIEDESDIQIHGIIGNEFFIENEWIIDFEKLTVYSTKQPV